MMAKQHGDIVSTVMASQISL